MQYLIFDTETNGLPKNWSAPITDVDNWPRLVQLAWILCDDQGNEINKQCRIVKPDGFEIPEAVTLVHGITTEIALEKGLPLSDVLTEFCADLRKETDLTLVAHNVSFDRRVLGAELLRSEMHNNFNVFFDGTPKICTMKSSQNFCNLPKKKWPKLEELHQILFNEPFADAHHADTDTACCAKCFFELQRRKIIA
jgi:DNA polymerase-3 subunit alpha/DNA polymerase-3 subunit epsilon